jgi:hypothetical protein
MSHYDKHKSLVALQHNYLVVDWYNEITGEIILESIETIGKFESVLKRPLNDRGEVRK